MKRCSVSLVIRETQIKAKRKTMRTPSEKLKRWSKPFGGKDTEQVELLIHCWVEGKTAPFLENVGSIY